MTESNEFEVHPIRGRFNSAFFAALDGYINWLVREEKRSVFSDLPNEVVEVGPGVGANFRYLPPGTRLVAIEPNKMMHARLRDRALKRGVDIDIRGVVGESIDLPDGSTDAVISSLLLCTVDDPQQVVREIKRVLRPGGRYAFLEHVAAPPGSVLRAVQRAVARPWAWTFEGCSVERDLAAVIRSGGFTSVEIESYRLRSPFIPANSQITGAAIA